MAMYYQSPGLLSGKVSMMLRLSSLILGGERAQAHG